MTDDFKDWTWGYRYPDGHIEVIGAVGGLRRALHAVAVEVADVAQVVAMPPDGTTWLVMESEGAVAHGAFVERPAGYANEEDER